MPEWALAPYVKMRPRIEAEQLQQLLAALLFTNGREMPGHDRNKYIGELEDAASGQSREPVKATPEMLRGLGMQVRVEDEHGKEVGST